jgi:catechol 2,3-dioxygenase-like lactoylglutathione lyase family enzyme
MSFQPLEGRARIARLAVRKDAAMTDGPVKADEKIDLATSGKSSPGKFAHAVLRTRDKFEEMVDWYLKVLNAKVVYSNGMLTFLSYDDEHHRIAIARNPGLAERPPCSTGLDHLAFTYGSLDELLGNYARLKAIGIEPFLPINHGPTTSLYYHDPDGNRIELQVDNFEDMAEATRHMEATFDRNPVGVGFDPDDYVLRRSAGTSPAELIRPPTEVAPPSMDVIRKLISS